MSGILTGKQALNPMKVKGLVLVFDLSIIIRVKLVFFSLLHHRVMVR